VPTADTALGTTDSTELKAATRTAHGKSPVTDQAHYARDL
jgi:hypothetical protein